MPALSIALAAKNRRNTDSMIIKYNYKSHKQTKLVNGTWIQRLFYFRR
jgi:hypothetical protein